MKKLICLFLSLCLLSLCLFSCDEDVDPNEGLESYTDFTMQDLNGNVLTLSDLVGSPIILNFWASWCPPCKSEMPDFQEAYSEYGSQIHFVMVSIDDTVSAAQGFISASGYSFPVYHDSYGQGASAYGITSIPQTYFINSDGYIELSYAHMISSSELQAGIDKIK